MTEPLGRTTPSWQVVPTMILTGASIGANATVICGVTIGKHSMVAAGAIVTKDVPDDGLVMGQPARLVDYVMESGERLHHAHERSSAYLCPPGRRSALSDMGR